MGASSDSSADEHEASARQKEIRERLQAIDPYEFESFVADVWEHRGWGTTVSPGSNDMGVDVVAHKEDGLVEQKAVIQAKRYTDGNKVGRPKIQQYHALKEQDSDADAAIVVTTSEFTSGATEWAAEHNVKLVDGDDLVAEIQSSGLGGLLDEYAPPIQELQDDVDEPDTDTADSSAESGSKKGTTSADAPPRDSYYALLVVGLLTQIGMLVLAGTQDILPAITTNMAIWIFLAIWIASPVLTFLDAQRLHKHVEGMAPNRIAYPAIVMFFGPLGAYYYLSDRSSGLSSDN